MKVLITGITGALGKMVAELLTARGHTVLGLDRRPWPDAPAGVTMFQADIRKRIETSSYTTPLMNEQIKRLDDMQASFDQTAGQPPQPPGPGALDLANRPGGVSGPPPASSGPEPTSVPPFPTPLPPPGTVSSDQ